MERITPNIIKRLEDNQVFVFGSNTQGRHGKGAALTARTKFGAIYGQSTGLQGQSYAIITKELRKDYEPVSLDEIKQGVDNFIIFAKENTHLTFYVVELGCNLAYFTIEEIAPLFKLAIRLKNVYLPQSFIDNLQTGFTI
jgi:hypothetical protein